MMAVVQQTVPAAGEREPAEDLAAAALTLARRFASGATMWCVAPEWPSHGHHVAVEFVHPVIVGKRALPAISLTSDVATITGVAAAGGMAGIFAHQIRFLAEPADIALGICADGDCPSVLAGLRAASDIGMLTIGLVGGDGGAIAASPAVNHLLTASSADPRIVKEMHVTAYHVLWELVHVFFEQPGILAPGVVA
jgi:D-sedoheptulose 7-phosphate isomerase